MRNFILSIGAGGGGAVTPEANFRAAFFNIWYYNKGTSSTTPTQWAAIVAHIERVDADILGLGEVNNSLWSELSGGLAATLGYPYSARGFTGSYGGCFLSKYPISNTQVLNDAYVQATFDATATNMLTAPNIQRAQITVEGQDLVVYTVHMNTNNGAFDPTTPQPYEEFERYAQMHRIQQDIALQRIANGDAKFLIIGDYNDGSENVQTATFAAAPSFPDGFVAGTQITALMPFDYANWPFDQVAEYDMTVRAGLDLDGSNLTTWDDTPNAAITVANQIDFISVDNRLTWIGSEVLNSEVDENSGLPKIGSPLASGSSRIASDHKLVFADFAV